MNYELADARLPRFAQFIIYNSYSLFRNENSSDSIYGY
jgi:hypothetical protein